MGKDDFRSLQGGRMVQPAPPMIAIDRFGNRVEAGHLVLFHANEDLVFEVVSVGPILHPGVQGGKAMQMVLKAEVPVQFAPAVPNRSVAIIGETQARIAARAGNNGNVAQPPSGLVLTDAPTSPQGDGDHSDVGDDAPPISLCSECGAKDGTPGEQCEVCATGIVTKVE